MTGINEQSAALRISDADRNGTLRRLHNAVALGLIDIDEFEERSALVSQARLHSDLDTLVGDLPGPGAIVTSATDRVELRGVMGSLKRQGEWTVPTGPARRSMTWRSSSAAPTTTAGRRPPKARRTSSSPARSSAARSTSAASASRGSAAGLTGTNA